MIQIHNHVCHVPSVQHHVPTTMESILYLKQFQDINGTQLVKLVTATMANT